MINIRSNESDEIVELTVKQLAVELKMNETQITNAIQPFGVLTNPAQIVFVLQTFLLNVMNSPTKLVHAVESKCTICWLT